MYAIPIYWSLRCSVEDLAMFCFLILLEQRKHLKHPLVQHPMIENDQTMKQSQKNLLYFYFLQAKGTREAMVLQQKLWI